MRGRSVWAGIVMFAAALILVSSSQAATMTTVTLTVNSTVDSTIPCTVVAGTSTGTCTLRGAILAANAYGHDNTLFVVNLRAKTYSLSLGTLNVAAATKTGNLVQIVGAGKDGPGDGGGAKDGPATVIDGSQNAKPATVFLIKSPTQMVGVTITGGSGGDVGCLGYYGCGGGIVLESALTLDKSVVRGNTACASWTGNSCNGPYLGGGGIYMPYGPRYESLTLYKTTVTQNVAGGGGGIAADDTEHALILATQSHIDNNTACFTFSQGACVDYGFGGGLANQGAQVMLDNSSVNGNVAGSAAYENGDGGGIYENGGSVHLNQTTVSGNSAGFRGGGVYDGGDVDSVDSTVSQNTAGVEGGGVYANAPATFIHTTIASNTAGGTFACTQGATTTCSQTVLATTGDCPTLYPSASTCNASAGLGGGVMAEAPASPAFIGSTVANNVAASIAGNATNCSGGNGGGVYSGWTVHLVAHSQLSGNVADCGGGLYSVPASSQGATYPFSLLNSTVSSNSALEDGGGIWTAGSGTGMLYGVSVTGNQAGRTTGGVWDDQLGSVLFGGDNKVAKNTSPDSCPNVSWPCS